MNKEEIKQLILQTIGESTSTSQYTVANVPLHVHNGIDAPFVSLAEVSVGNNIVDAFGNKLEAQLRNSTQILSGYVVLVAGQSTITDTRITSNSVIVVTSQFSGNPAAVYMLGAICLNGSAQIFENSHTSIDTVNYLIIT